MKWVFVVAGFAMVIIGGIGKYVDMTKYKEPFISNMSPYYTIFITGIITVILGLSFDWIMGLDDEEEGEGGEPPEGEGEQPAEEAAEEGAQAQEHTEAKPEGEDAEPESAGEAPAEPEKTAPEGDGEPDKSPSSD